MLVEDDQADQRRIACAMLTKLGYQASAVAGGEEAIEYVQHHAVDLLILDMIMDPGIGGRETFERIRATHPTMKAVIASGYALSDDVRAVRALGAGSFVRKPYTLESLGFAVQRELRSADSSPD